MPWKSDSIIIRNTKHDRVRKLNPSQRADVLRLYQQGMTGVDLAKIYKVANSTIYRIIHPERYKMYGKKKYENYKHLILKEHKQEAYKEHRRMMRKDLNLYKQSLP